VPRAAALPPEDEGRETTNPGGGNVTPQRALSSEVQAGATELPAQQRCGENQYADTHCWHWRGGPPTIHTEVQADCCWCGLVRVFGYEDVLNGHVGVTNRAHYHGTARDWLNQPTTYALGRLSAKGAARDHAQKMAERPTEDELVARGMRIVQRLQVEHEPRPPTAMLRAFARWWDSHGEKWRRLEASRRRDYLNTFAAGYAAAAEPEPLESAGDEPMESA
jgi:hypothetical protein